MNKTLPIGAIIKLNGAEAPLMIIGYLPKGIDNKQRDYMGIIYPTGITNINDIRAFNKEDIKEILYNGYENSQIFKKFINKINKQ